MKTIDTIIIGGGIVGSTAAYYLATNGKNTLLIDHGVGQATKAAVGLVCPWLAQKRNKDWYRLTAGGAAFYQSFLKDLEADQVPTDFYKHTGTLVLKSSEKPIKKILKIAEERKPGSPEMGDLTVSYGQELLEMVPDLTTDPETVLGGIFASGGGRVDGALLVDRLQTRFQELGGQVLQGQAKLNLPENQGDHYEVTLGQESYQAKEVILATGAWLPHILEPLGYEVDVRPQKGQLLEIDSNFATDTWPGLMLYGEIDILPYDGGRLVIGASHENDMGYDLTLDQDILASMQARAEEFIPDLKGQEIARTRVGTRAYTSTYAPFYGQLTDQAGLYMASGLGSTGITNGPFIGWQLAMSTVGKDSNFDASPYSPDTYVIKK